MATTKDYDYVLITDADKKAILEPELRNAEIELYRATVNDLGNIDALRARADDLKARYEALSAD